MSSIYKPPESNLEIDKNASYRPHTMWRVFLWFNVAMLPLILIVLGTIQSLSYLDYIDMTLFVFVLLGLFSYSYNRKIFSRIIWILSFITYPLWFVFYEIIGPLLIEMTHYGEPAVIDEFIIISLLFFAPTMYALYSLSFKAKTLNISNNKINADQ